LAYTITLKSFTQSAFLKNQTCKCTIHYGAKNEDHKEGRKAAAGGNKLICLTSG
jgi:hypothetical protein